MKRIIFTVTNDLEYDQRMTRICTGLQCAGYSVKLIGVKRPDSNPLEQKEYAQKRLKVFFQKGFAFYAEYNIRLFIYLLFCKTDIYTCIDLDTILPVYYASKIRGKKRVYDAHEYFSQQKEIVTRPKVYKVWSKIEKKYLPLFPKGYTVAESIAKEFENLYGVKYEVIRNVSKSKSKTPNLSKEKNILYQGSVNEARGFEILVPAMRQVSAQLEIYGRGNFEKEVRNLIHKNDLENKVLLKGKYSPGALDLVTENAYIGINLVEHLGLNQYFSLANKFFDYIQNGVPQITMDFPEYRKINDKWEVAILIKDLSEKTVAQAINLLLTDEELYHKLRKNCLEARKVLIWENEEKKLLHFYEQL